MRVDRLAGLRVDRQLRRVDQRGRVARSSAGCCPGSPGRSLAGIECMQVLVQLLEVGHLDSRLRRPRSSWFRPAAAQRSRCRRSRSRCSTGCRRSPGRPCPGNESDGNGVCAFANSTPPRTSPPVPTWVVRARTTPGPSGADRRPTATARGRRARHVRTSKLSATPSRKSRPPRRQRRPVLDPPTSENDASLRPFIAAPQSRHPATDCRNEATRRSPENG